MGVADLRRTSPPFALRQPAAALVGLLSISLVGCSAPTSDDTALHPPSSPTAPASSSPRAPTASPAPPDTTSLLTAAAVIARAGRPVAGAAAGRHVLLLYVSKALSAVRLYNGDAVSEHMLSADVPSYLWEFPIITPYPGGFVIVLETARLAWHVGMDGTVSGLAFSRTAAPPDAGDVLVKPSRPTFDSLGRAAFTPAWLFRPSSRAVLTGPALPPGAHLTHVDGRRTLWAIAPPRQGRSVLLSAAPGGRWVAHVVGSLSSTFRGCACDTDPGPHGRGGVLVLAGNPLQHVSTDYGRTWRTYDLATTVPYIEVTDRDRGPRVSALPDGRLVIGYDDYWVADDPSNRSFTKTHDVRRVLWAAGLDDALLFRDDEASADGGRTWVTYRP